ASGVVPKELYFYRSPVPLNQVRTIEDRGTLRWVNLEDSPDRLIETLLASAAIFPGFPPKNIDNIRLRSANGSRDEKDRTYSLVDGGFLHNVPVQAAVELGATHIIILDVHPPEKRDESVAKHIPLGPNLLNAFNLL